MSDDGLSESRPEGRDHGHTPGGEDHRHRAQRDGPLRGICLPAVPPLADRDAAHRHALLHRGSHAGGRLPPASSPSAPRLRDGDRVRPRPGRAGRVDVRIRSSPRQPGPEVRRRPAALSPGCPTRSRHRWASGQTVQAREVRATQQQAAAELDQDVRIKRVLGRPRGLQRPRGCDHRHGAHGSDAPSGTEARTECAEARARPTIANECVTSRATPPKR